MSAEKTRPIEKSATPRAFQAFELAGWEGCIAGYDRHFAPLTAQSVEATLEAARVAPGMRVLDVCCGPGLLAAGAAERGARAVGLDFSRAVVALARARVPGAAFLEGDAQALPFEDASFDAVVCGFGIIHLPDPEKALAEIARVLRPGGRAAVSVWAPPGPETGFGLFYAAVKAHGSLDVGLPHGPDVFQFSAPGRLEAALAAAGLGDVGSREVAQSWALARAGDLAAAILEGSVRARALFAGQAEAARAAIAAALEAGLERFRAGAGGYAVPMPALLGWGGR